MPDKVKNAKKKKATVKKVAPKKANSNAGKKARKPRSKK